MDTAKLNEWMQVIGIFAVVLSLIFVGLQMRQTQDIARATLYQMRSDSSREVGIMVIESQETRALYLRAMEEGMQGFTPGDMQLMFFTCETVLGHFENSHHLYTLDFLSEEQWDADRRQIAMIMRNFCGLLWTDQQRSGYRASFVDEIDALLQNEIEGK